MTALAVLALALLAFPEAAYAFDMDYYTYKGFKETTSALKKIALIFSDSNYKGLAATAAVVGLGVAGIRFYASLAMTGLKGGMLGWAVPPIIGMVLFIAFIVPKGRLAVYDPVLNRSQIIDGIPDGVVLIVGGLNAIERGMVDMIGAGGAAGVGGGLGPAPAPASEGVLGVLGDIVDASAADYTLQAQGVGFNIIAQLFKYPAEINEDLRGNIYHYIKDCVVFELQNKQQGLTISSLKNSPNFVDEFAKAANPAIFTVTTTETVNWAGSDGESQPKRTTCQSLWQEKISGPLASAGPTFKNSVAKMCVQAGFDASAGGINQCSKSVEGLMTVIFGPSASGLGTAEFFRQWELAEMMRKVLLGDNLDVKAMAKTNTQAMSGMIAGGMQAHEWMPSVRAVTTAIAFGMLPFTLLFLPTPLFGRSVSLAAGFNVWLAAWGVTDATIHSALMSQAADVFAATRPNGMGMASMLVFPDATERALALFSNARWMSMTLAAVFAAALVKFGGYAFTAFTQSMSGQAQSASAAGGAMATPEGQAGALKQTTTALPDMWNQSRWDLTDRTTAEGFRDEADMRANLGASARMGGPVAAGERVGAARAYDMETAARATEGKLDAGITPGTEAGRNVSDARFGIAGATARTALYNAAKAEGIIDKNMSEDDFYKQLQSHGTVAGRDGQHAISAGDDGKISFAKTDSGRDRTRHDSNRTIRDNSTRTTAGAQIDADSVYSLVQSGRLASSGLNLSRVSDRGVLAEKVTDFITRNYASQHDTARESITRSTTDRHGTSSGESGQTSVGLGASIFGSGASLNTSTTASKTNDQSFANSRGNDLSSSAQWNRISGEVRTAIDGAGGDVGKTQDALKQLYQKYDEKSRGTMMKPL